MFKDDDSGGVVDQQLRVFGIKNLKMDCGRKCVSQIPSGHLMAPTIVVCTIHPTFGI